MVSLREEGLGMSDIANKLGSMSLGDLVAKGGSYVLLQKELGVHIPPGYIVFQCSYGYMKTGENSDGEEEEDDADKTASLAAESPSFLAPWLLSLTDN